VILLTFRTSELLVFVRTISKKRMIALLVAGAASARAAEKRWSSAKPLKAHQHRSLSIYLCGWNLRNHVLRMEHSSRFSSDPDSVPCFPTAPRSCGGNGPTQRIFHAADQKASDVICLRATRCRRLSKKLIRTVTCTEGFCPPAAVARREEAVAAPRERSSAKKLSHSPTAEKKLPSAA